MAAFSRAIADGADGVELDVRLCRSGELVVAHDPDLRRVSEPGSIGELTLGELRARDLGGGEKVPLLDEVLDLATGGRFMVDVEVKTNGPRGAEVAGELCRRLSFRALESADHILVSSFDPRALAVVRFRAPRLASGLLFGSKQRWLLRSGLLAVPLGASAVHPELRLVSPALVRAWHRMRRAVNVWTVDDPPALRRLRDLRVDAIITNDPGAARRALEG